MPKILGVDGGGSKTYTVICDEKGNRLSTGLSGCGNYQTIGIDNAVANIKESIEKALSDASLTYSDIDFVQYGLAGADRPKDFSIIRKGLQVLPFQSWDVVCDTMEGLRIGAKDNTGVVLICGAGTNAAGRNKGGDVVQTGGFGYLYGDWAGGEQMATETFRAAVRSWERREIPSILTERVPEFFQYEGMEALINDFLDHERSTVPFDLTLLLHEAADSGDQLSISIMEKTGRELGKAALSVIRRLGGFGETVPIVLTGSVLQKGRNEHLLQALRDELMSENMTFEFIIPVLEPVYGALLLGMDRLKLTVTDDIYTKFSKYGGVTK